jgi:hypothetical protein
MREVYLFIERKWGRRWSRAENTPRTRKFEPGLRVHGDHTPYQVGAGFEDPEGM